MIHEPFCFDGRWQVGDKIGSGSTGDVYAGKDKVTGDNVAIKVARPGKLKREIWAYERIWKSTTDSFLFPQLYASGCYQQQDFMICELLGPNLFDLLQFCNDKFSPCTVMRLAEQILNRLQRMHILGFTHGSVKPQNICMGTKRNIHRVYLVDYGSCSVIQGHHKSQNATSTWLSINRHEGCRHSMRDDLESWIYCLLFFLEGKLPWEAVESDKVAETKRISTPRLAEKHGLLKAWLHIRSLAECEKPDYVLLKRIISTAKGQSEKKLFCWFLIPTGNENLDKSR